MSSASRPAPARMDEEGEASANNTNSVTSTSSSSASSNIGATNTGAVASPSVRRQGRLLDLDSLKATPQKCLEDKGYVQLVYC